MSRAPAQHQLFMLACVLLFTSKGLSAQEVRGFVVAESSGEPVSGALVELLDEQSARSDATLAEEDGAFLLNAPTPGSYTIQVQRIGFAVWVSDPLDIEPGVRSVRLEVPVDPIPLPELFVESGRRCRTPRDEALRAYALYNKVIRKLEPVVWAETGGLYVFQVHVHESLPDFGKDSLKSTRYLRHRVEPETVLLPVPVATLEPSSLARDGYIRPGANGVMHYFAPTAATLVSGEFRDTHCFTTRTDSDGRLGLEFEPLPGREIPDVKGVLWLDESGELEALDFEFTRLRQMIDEYQVPYVVDEMRARADNDPRMVGYVLILGGTDLRFDFGGRLEFERLANGAWITRRWELLLPLLGMDGQWLWERRPPRAEVRPAAARRIRMGEVTGVAMRQATQPTLQPPDSF